MNSSIMGHYDIFISYRRVGGAQYARILQLMLIQRGYRVFLDYDELTDGVFSEKIKEAIREAPVFIIVLSKGSMKRCVNSKDLLREEITLAMQLNKHIVPVNPDNLFDGFPSGMPKDLESRLSSLQFSDISFGQALGVMIDLMIINRLVSTLGKRMPQNHRDVDLSAAKEKPQRQDAKHNGNKLQIRYAIVTVILILMTVIGFGKYYQDKKYETKVEKVRYYIQEKYKKFHLLLNSDMTLQQIYMVDTLLQNMIEIYPDSIWISQFEFTEGQWHLIRGTTCDTNRKYYPIANISFADIIMCLSTLSDMTNITFELPSVEVWRYAAKGGHNNESLLYAGSDDVNKVAWYRNNSGGDAHASDGQQNKEPNVLDLYDMSGNISEFCNTSYDDSGLYYVCGGDYDSPSSEVTVNSVKGFSTTDKDKHVGFRVIVRKP